MKSFRLPEIIILLVFAVCIGASQIAEGGFKEGMDAYLRKDYLTAFKELKPVAEQGGAEAQYILGRMYRRGLGVVKDSKEAVKWYQKSADQGLAIAQHNLGLMHVKGEGVSKSEKDAVKWWQKAAEQGYVSSQNNLGWMYANGLGVRKDYIRGHMWANIASVGGDANAITNRDRVERKMTRKQIQEATRLAREWMEKNQKR